MASQNILTRALMIAAMTAVVMLLIELTAPIDSVSVQTGPVHTDPIPAETAQIINDTPDPPAGPIAVMAASWTGEIVFGAAYSALSPLNSEAAAAIDSRFDPADDYWGLPRSEGFETVAAYCSACHSLAIVMQQRQDADGWNYLFDWMIEKQGMAAPPDDMRAEMVSYLSREFGQE